MAIDPITGGDPPPQQRGLATRIEHARARAEEAAARYRELARRNPVYALPIVALTTYVARQGMLLASAIAFRTFLWLMPLALLFAGVLTGLGQTFPSIAQRAQTTNGVAAVARKQITAALQDGGRSWWVAVIIGVFALLWTTRTLMRNLIQATAHIWEAPSPHQTQRQVAVSSLVFAGAWLLLFLAAALIAALEVVPAGLAVTFVLQVALSSLTWLAISLRLPDRRRSWRDLVPGSVLFGAGLALMQLVGRVYLPARFEHSSELYGSLGIAAVILVWLLAVGHLTILSALVNRVWLDYRLDQQREDGVTVPAPAPVPGRPTTRE